MGPMTRSAVAALAISIAMLAARESRADSTPAPLPDTLLPITPAPHAESPAVPPPPARHDTGYGVSAGGTFAALRDSGWTGAVGGEASGLWLRAPHDAADSLLWLGGYLEAVRDFGAHTERFSAGPEAGKGLFGVDAGPLVELPHGAAGTRVGATARLVERIGYTETYVRYNRYFDSRAGANGVELGLLLKLPVLKRGLHIW